jgi:hypothetical protein
MVVCLAGCGSSVQRLDNRRVESAIAAAIHRQRRLDATVTCPRAQLKAGEVFDCVATPAGGGRATYFQVTEADGAGHVHFLGLR